MPIVSKTVKLSPKAVKKIKSRNRSSTKRKTTIEEVLSNDTSPSEKIQTIIDNTAVGQPDSKPTTSTQSIIDQIKEKRSQLITDKTDRVINRRPRSRPKPTPEPEEDEKKPKLEDFLPKEPEGFQPKPTQPTLTPSEKAQKYSVIHDTIQDRISNLSVTQRTKDTISKTIPSTARYTSTVHGITPSSWKDYEKITLPAYAYSSGNIVPEQTFDPQETSYDDFVSSLSKRNQQISTQEYSDYLRSKFNLQRPEDVKFTLTNEEGEEQIVDLNELTNMGYKYYSDNTGKPIIRPTYAEEIGKETYESMIKNAMENTGSSRKAAEQFVQAGLAQQSQMMSPFTPGDVISSGLDWASTEMQKGEVNEYLQGKKSGRWNTVEQYVDTKFEETKSGPFQSYYALQDSKKQPGRQDKISSIQSALDKYNAGVENNIWHNLAYEHYKDKQLWEQEDKLPWVISKITTPKVSIPVSLLVGAGAGLAISTGMNVASPIAQGAGRIMIQRGLPPILAKTVSHAPQIAGVGIVGAAGLESGKAIIESSRGGDYYEKVGDQYVQRTHHPLTGVTSTGLTILSGFGGAAAGSQIAPKFKPEQFGQFFARFKKPTWTQYELTPTGSSETLVIGQQEVFGFPTKDLPVRYTTRKDVPLLPGRTSSPITGGPTSPSLQLPAPPIKSTGIVQSENMMVGFQKEYLPNFIRKQWVPEAAVEAVRGNIPSTALESDWKILRTQEPVVGKTTIQGTDIVLGQRTLPTNTRQTRLYEHDIEYTRDPFAITKMYRQTPIRKPEYNPLENVLGDDPSNLPTTMIKETPGAPKYVRPKSIPKPKPKPPEFPYDSTKPGQNLVQQKPPAKPVRPGEKGLRLHDRRLREFGVDISYGSPSSSQRIKFNFPEESSEIASWRKYTRPKKPKTTPKQTPSEFDAPVEMIPGKSQAQMDAVEGEIISVYRTTRPFKYKVNTKKAKAEIDNLISGKGKNTIEILKEPTKTTKTTTVPETIRSRWTELQQQPKKTYTPPKTTPTFEQSQLDTFFKKPPQSSQFPSPGKKTSGWAKPKPETEYYMYESDYWTASSPRSSGPRGPTTGPKPFRSTLRIPTYYQTDITGDKRIQEQISPSISTSGLNIGSLSQSAFTPSFSTARTPDISEDIIDDTIQDQGFFPVQDTITDQTYEPPPPPPPSYIQRPRPRPPTVTRHQPKPYNYYTWLPDDDDENKLYKKKKKKRTTYGYFERSYNIPLIGEKRKRTTSKKPSFFKLVK